MKVVYVLQGIGPHFGGLCKIGITSSWPRRSQELKVGTATRALFVIPIRKHREMEQQLHRRYASKRLPQTEWFALDASDVATIKQLLRDRAWKDTAGRRARETHERNLREFAEELRRQGQERAGALVVVRQPAHQPPQSPTRPAPLHVPPAQRPLNAVERILALFMVMLGPTILFTAFGLPLALAAVLPWTDPIPGMTNSEKVGHSLAWGLAAASVIGIAAIGAKQGLGDLSGGDG